MYKESLILCTLSGQPRKSSGRVHWETPQLQGLCIQSILKDPTQHGTLENTRPVSSRDRGPPSSKLGQQQQSTSPAAIWCARCPHIPEPSPEEARKGSFGLCRCIALHCQTWLTCLFTFAFCGFSPQPANVQLFAGGLSGLSYSGNLLCWHAQVNKWQQEYAKALTATFNKWCPGSSVPLEPYPVRQFRWHMSKHGALQQKETHSWLGATQDGFIGKDTQLSALFADRKKEAGRAEAELEIF